MENNVTVLLIDNNEVDNFIHQRVLEKFSDRIRLIIFTNTSDVLMHITKNKIAPLYIFLSMNYPASDNFGFLKQLEILNVNKENITICILSTLLLPTDIEKLKIDNNYIGYVEKPLTREKLHSIFDEQYSAFGLHGK